MDTVDPDWERRSIPVSPSAYLDFIDRPGIATLYAIWGVLLDLLAMLLAALIVLFLVAELSSN